MVWASVNSLRTAAGCAAGGGLMRSSVVWLQGKNSPSKTTASPSSTPSIPEPPPERRENCGGVNTSQVKHASQQTQHDRVNCEANQVVSQISHMARVERMLHRRRRSIEPNDPHRVGVFVPDATLAFACTAHK